MRPIETIVVAGAGLILLGFGAGWRVRRGLPWVVVALAVVHWAVEGHRLAMWPAYLIGFVAAALTLVRGPARAPTWGRWRRVGRGIVAALLFLVAIPLPVLWPVMKLPVPGGPFGVGQRWLVVVDSSRRERFLPDGVRRFPVKLWYPAPPGVTGTRARYGDPREMAGAALPVALFAQVSLIHTHAIIDAPLAAGDRFPVLVFSHGYGGGFGQNTVQMEELASQGYMVASIAHPGEAAWAPFPDGTGMAMDTGITNLMARMAGEPGAEKKALESMARLDSVPTAAGRVAALRQFLSEGPEPLRSESIAEWAADTRALVDLLATFEHGGAASPFPGRLDLARLGVFGMSYGGATAAEFCRLDSRCKAALNIDGGQYGGLVNDSLLVPFMIMASSQARAVHGPVLELARGPAYLITVPETTHMGLTDLTLAAPRLFRWIGVTGALDPDRRQSIMTAYTVGFFDTYLKGIRSPLFDGSPTPFPDVVVVRRNTP